MTDQEIIKFGEIQYLKGRLDELYKAIPTVTNMDRRRKLDQRIEKYINKLKKVDEGGNPIPLGEKSKRRLNLMIEDVNGEA